MTISPKTRKMLWGRAANRCVFSDCRRELVMNISATDDPTVIGEEAHIVAREKDGPRGSDGSREGIDKYSNLLLLCSVHHKIIDDNVQEYPVVKLKDLKDQHEKWVREALDTFDPIKQREEELIVSYLEEWAVRFDIEEWENWTSWIFGGGQPEIRKGRFDILREGGVWLLSRAWPDCHTDLRNAIENFRKVLSDFLLVLEATTKTYGADEDSRLLVEKRYKKLESWDEGRHKSLLDQFNFSVDLIEDLCLELTRAANLVCSTVRKSLLPTYRLKEGVLLVQRGPDMNLRTQIMRTEYGSDAIARGAYRGLQSFVHDRSGRDFCIGDGPLPKELEREFFGFFGLS